MQYAIIWKNGKYSWSRPIIKSYYVLVFTVKQCIAGVFLGFCEIPLVHSFYYDFLIVVLRSTSKTESSTTIGRYLCRQPQLVVTFAINHNWSLPLPSTKIGRYLCRQPQLVVTFAINQNWSLPLPSKYSKQAFTFDSTLYFIVSFLVCFLGIVFEIDAFSLAALTVLTFLDKFKINMGTEVKVN